MQYRLCCVDSKKDDVVTKDTRQAITPEGSISCYDIMPEELGK